MRIVVCVKQVLDPELPARTFRLDETGRRPAVVGPRAGLTIDSYAENALEAGLQLRDQVAGSRLTALCLGDASADDVIRRAFALTADAGARVWDESWRELDGLAVAHLLARAIRRLGGADLVLCGRQAADIEEGVVGPALAEELNAPCVTLVDRLVPTAAGLEVEREAEGDRETLAVPLPAVVTVTSAKTNVARMPRIKDTMLARSKPIQVLGAAELEAEPARAAAAVVVERLHLPTTVGACEMLAGESADALATALADRLQELKIP